MSALQKNSVRSNLLVAVSAFCVYFCMYAFRKPFTAATFKDELLWGFELKSVLVLSQLLGYMLSKFIGIKVVSEMPRSHRAIWLLMLVGIAEAALILFAFVPPRLKVAMMFLNGLPLGMVFGIVLAYLEGRQQTEALAAGLCASFIVSSGFVKFVGRWLIEVQNVSEYSMPAITGAIFLLPLMFFLYILEKSPEPTEIDRKLRSERRAMSKEDRRRFFRTYTPGLSGLLLVYVALTVIRTIRDDFGVEIWQGMGITEKPAVFAQSETIVGIVATGINAFAILLIGNLRALRVTTFMMCGGFLLTIAATMAQWNGHLSPFAFMVMVGIGLYIPYVAFHTTVFERIVSASKCPGNLAFLMYLADSLGYLGYATVLIFRTSVSNTFDIMTTFRWIILWCACISIAALIFALLYFQKTLSDDNASATTELRS